MDATDVYAKTPAGQDEVATRSRQLPSRLRQLLIMVDGKRSVGEMLAHHPAAAEAQASLAALLEAGLIALVPKPAVEPSPAPAPPQADIPAMKKFILVTLRDTLGPDADLFSAKIEATATLPAVMAQAEKMREVLRGAAGNKKADAFWAQLNAMVTPG